MKTLTERLTELRDGASKRIAPGPRSIMQRATSDLRAAGILSRLPLAGSALPPFELRDSAGETWSSQDLLARGPLVITFYRGTW